MKSCAILLLGLAVALTLSASPGVPARADEPPALQWSPQAIDEMPVLEPEDMGSPMPGIAVQTVACTPDVPTAAFWFCPPPPDPIRQRAIVDDDFSGGSTAGIFSTAITTLNVTAGTRSSALRVTVALTGADSVLNFQVIMSGKTITMPLNSGTALTSSAGVYTFVVGVCQAMTSDTGTNKALTYNFSLTSSTRVGFMLVEECASDGI